MNDYEMVVLLHPDLEIDVDKPLKKIEKIVKDNSGKVVAVDNWGKRKLAYKIKKQDHAVYVCYQLQLDPKVITKLEGTLNITDEVIRYLIAKPGPEIEESDKKSKEAKSDKKTESKEKSEEKPEKANAKSSKEDEKEG